MRRLTVRTAALCLIASALASGCRQTANLSKQEVVVTFAVDATPADHARVWALCQHVDGAVPEPLVTKSKYPATLRFNVRYRVDHATNFQLQQLYDCLKQDPTVLGFGPGDSADN